MTPTPESQQAALKPCPFCRELLIELPETRSGVMMHPFGGEKKPSCVLDGLPVSKNQFSLWNTRATPVSESHVGLGDEKMRPTLGRSDWVDCPICGEPDMRKQIDPDSDDGQGYIYCVNTNCGSNGGDNFAALRAHPAGGVKCETCNGNGVVGGFVNAESGYQDDPCPSCASPHTGKSE